MPALALGALDVSLLNLTSAYAALADGGVLATPRLYSKVLDRSGKELAEAPSLQERVASEPAVFVLTNILQGVIERGTGKVVRRFGFELPAAGKTGTTNENRDAWFVGYTGHMVTGVWLGNDDSSPTKKATGSGLPVEIWDRFMRAAHQNVPVVSLPGTNLYVGGGWAQGPTPMAPQPYPQGQPYPQQNGMLPPGNVGAPPARSNNPFTQIFDALFGRR